MTTFYKTFFSSLAAGIILVATFFAGYLVRDQQVSGRDFPILIEAKNLLNQYGYHPVPDGPVLEYGMIRGMIQAYNDPYTSFSEPVQHELASNSLEGKFGGIGVQLQEDSQGYPVLIPIPGSPAEKIGILEGDRLVQADELLILAETPHETIQAAIRGKVGTKVVIVIERPPDYHRLEFEIERAEFNLPSVTGYLAPGESRLGIIKVNLMAATTPDEIKATVNDLQDRGALVFALDLRDNFGGLLTSGVDTARLFLMEGQVMQEQYKGQEVKSYSVENPGSLTDLPLVILVNQNTASAAEIAAGALQAQQRAILIGARTYGKDSVQLVFELKDKSSLQVTAARWWIPTATGGQPQPLAGVGLQPDIILDMTELSGQDQSIDPVLQQAIQYLLGGT